MRLKENTNSQFANYFPFQNYVSEFFSFTLSRAKSSRNTVQSKLFAGKEVYSRIPGIN
jgi:hypothetical protein